MSEHEKIVRVMVENRWKEWWFAKDFLQIRVEGLFIGYEVTARLSELVNKYPYAFATKKEGRFRAIKIAMPENKTQINALAPRWLSYLLVEKYATY